jgi:hypothetical protein
MAKYWRYGLMVVILIIAVALAIYIFSNTTLHLSGSSLENGEFSMESEFPNATCRKVIQFGFPPIKLECEEKEDSEHNQ